MPRQFVFTALFILIGISSLECEELMYGSNDTCVSKMNKDPMIAISRISKFITDYHKKRFRKHFQIPAPYIAHSKELFLPHLHQKLKGKAKEEARERRVFDSDNPSNFRIKCKTLERFQIPTVEIANTTELMKILESDYNDTDTSAAMCTLVLFYSNACPFSATAAPHFNALPRVFPDIRMVAFNSYVHTGFNTQLAIISLPTLILFENGMPLIKFPNTHDLESYTKFIVKYTTLTPKEVSLWSSDFGGPLSVTPIREYNNTLIMSVLVSLAIIYYVSYCVDVGNGV